MGFFSFVGDVLNDLTGGSSAAKKSQGYALQSAAQEQQYNVEAMKLQNQFQKEFAQNAHQWEAEDLMKSGYNPALTTGLGGASAGGAGGGSGAAVGSATVPAGGTDIISMISGIANIYNSTSATKAQTKLAGAETDLKIAQTIKQIMDNEAFKKFGEDTQKNILINLIKSGGQIDANTLLTNKRARTEGQRFYTELANTDKTSAEADIAVFDRLVHEKDYETLNEYGITRTEALDLFKQFGSEFIELLKAGKYAKIAEMAKNMKGK